MNSTSKSTVSSECRFAIAVRGVVQGVGFRPFVYSAACDRGLAAGCNEADMVRIARRASWRAGGVRRCDSPLSPPQGRIDGVEIAEIEIEESSGFEICTSEGTSAPRPTIPADLATCDECLAEIRDPSQRRYNYPFTNCTRCGPRWSIIERLPYDRPRTSMAGFAMCPDCQAEYDDPADRRFHAQPIACPRCGPKLQLLDSEGRETAAGPGRVRCYCANALGRQDCGPEGTRRIPIVGGCYEPRGRRPIARAETAARSAVCGDVCDVGGRAAVLLRFGRRSPRALLASIADRAVKADAKIVKPQEAVNQQSQISHLKSQMHSPASPLAIRISE